MVRKFLAYMHGVSFFVIGSSAYVSIKYVIAETVMKISGDISTNIHVTLRTAVSNVKLVGYLYYVTY